jgi:hypothetical protein
MRKRRIIEMEDDSRSKMTIDEIVKKFNITPKFILKFYDVSDGYKSLDDCIMNYNYDTKRMNFFDTKNNRTINGTMEFGGEVTVEISHYVKPYKEDSEVYF